MKVFILISAFIFFSTKLLAYDICFSNADAGVPSFQVKQYESQFKQSLVEKDNESIIYFMTWNAGNNYPVDSELYHLQNQAIFFDAVKGNKFDTIKRMLEKKIHIDINRLTKIDYQLTGLMIASKCGYKEMVKILLNAGADVNVIGGYGGSNNITAISEARQLYYNDDIELEDIDEIIAMLKNSGGTATSRTSNVIRTK